MAQVTALEILLGIAVTVAEMRLVQAVFLLMALVQVALRAITPSSATQAQDGVTQMVAVLLTALVRVS